MDELDYGVVKEVGAVSDCHYLHEHCLDNAVVDIDQTFVTYAGAEWAMFV